MARLDELELLDLPGLQALERESPKDVDLLVMIGKRYLQLGRLPECHIFYSRALAIAPDDGWTHIYFGNLCFALFCYDEAVLHFKRAIELLPDVSCPYWCLADVYAAQGYINRTELEYKRAVEIEPNDIRAKRKLDEWLSRGEVHKTD